MRRYNALGLSLGKNIIFGIYLFFISTCSFSCCNRINDNSRADVSALTISDADKITKIAIAYVKAKKLPLNGKVGTKIVIDEFIGELRDPYYSYLVNIYLDGDKKYMINVNKTSYAAEDIIIVRKGIPIWPYDEK